jgi:hypothetical protein
MSETVEKKYVRKVMASVLVSQIGHANVLAISGGRVIDRGTGITLPVSNGYSVEIDLNFMDLYDVKRVYTRAGKRTIKGEVTDVHASNVGRAAYYASCFVNRTFGEDKK